MAANRQTTSSRGMLTCSHVSRALPAQGVLPVEVEGIEAGQQRRGEPVLVRVAGIQPRRQMAPRGPVGALGPDPDVAIQCGAKAGGDKRLQDAQRRCLPVVLGPAGCCLQFVGSSRSREGRRGEVVVLEDKGRACTCAQPAVLHPSGRQHVLAGCRQCPAAPVQPDRAGGGWDRCTRLGNPGAAR